MRRAKLILVIILLLLNILVISPVFFIDTIKAAPSYLTLRPNGQWSTYYQWTDSPDVGNDHWQNVDETVADGDTTRLSHILSAAIKVDIWTMEDHTTESGDIESITVYFTMKASGWDIAEHNVEHLCGNYSIAMDNEWLEITSDYVEYSKVYTTSPTDGQPWDWEEVDNMQLGVQAYGSASPECTATVTQAYAVVKYTVSATLDDPTEDGCIYWDGAYERDNSYYHIYFGGYGEEGAWYDDERGYVEWDISSLAGGTLTANPVFKYEGVQIENYSTDAEINPITEGQPSVISDEELYGYIASGTAYVDPFNFQEGENKEVDLGASAKSDLQSAMDASQSWFAIGFQSPDDEGATEDKTSAIRSEEYASTPNPTLYVEYTPGPPPNNVPTQSGEIPINSSTGISLTPDLYVLCNDADGDSMNATWWSNSSGAWLQFASNWTSFADNTNITQSFANASVYSTKYYWSVNLTDGTDWCNETYHFTTRPENYPPTISGENPGDGSTDISLTPDLYVLCNDADGDSMNATWWSNSSGAWLQFASNWTSFADNTNITQTFTNVTAYSTTYYWSVNLTDGTDWTNETYTFTTREPFFPSPPSSFTAVASSRTDISLSWTHETYSDKVYIRYKTGSYPTNRNDGTFLANTSSSVAMAINLNSGTEYFFRAWAWNESDGVWSTSTSDVSERTYYNIAPIATNEYPSHLSTFVSTYTDSLSVIISDYEGDEIDWSIATSPNIGSNSGTTFATEVSCPVSNLNFSTTYTWYVNLTDGENITSEVFQFETMPQPDAYVDDDNIDPAWYNESNHFRKIEDAIDAISPGQTIYVYNGTYYETGMDVQQRMNLIGENKKTTIIDGGYSERVLTFSNDAEYSNISGFTIRHSGSYAAPIWHSGITLWEDYVTISDCIFDDNYIGVHIKGGTHNTIHHCHFQNQRYITVRIHDSSYNNVHNCTFYVITEGNPAFDVWYFSTYNDMTDNYILSEGGAIAIGYRSDYNSFLRNDVHGSNSNLIGINQMSDTSSDNNNIYHNNFYDGYYIDWHPSVNANHYDNGPLILRPNADGAFSQWLSTNASHYEAVDDVTPDNDTTHIRTGTDGYKDYFGLPDHTTETASIINVTVKGSFGNGAATLNLTIYDTSSSNNQSGQISYPSSGYHIRNYTFTTNPAGGSWTWNGIDDLQIGVEKVSGAFPYCTQLYAIVYYHGPLGLDTPYRGNYWNDYEEKYPGATNDGVVWDIPYELQAGNQQDNYPLVEPAEPATTAAFSWTPYRPTTEDNVLFIDQSVAATDYWWYINGVLIVTASGLDSSDQFDMTYKFNISNIYTVTLVVYNESTNTTDSVTRYIYIDRSLSLDRSDASAITYYGQSPKGDMSASELCSLLGISSDAWVHKYNTITERFDSFWVDFPGLTTDFNINRWDVLAIVIGEDVDKRINITEYDQCATQVLALPEGYNYICWSNITATTSYNLSIGLVAAQDRVYKYNTQTGDWTVYWYGVAGEDFSIESYDILVLSLGTAKTITIGDGFNG